MENERSLVAFEKYKIRRLYDDQAETWYFSVIDVVAALTDSVNPRDYWFKMKIRVKTEDGLELSTICRQLKMKAPDGKMRQTDCTDVQGLLRIIQSIPSPKAEPFKQWLAKVGYERIQDMSDPSQNRGYTFNRQEEQEPACSPFLLKIRDIKDHKTGIEAVCLTKKGQVKGSLFFTLMGLRYAF